MQMKYILLIEKLYTLWTCPMCGLINDRDLLAAQNILRKGISELESQGNSSKKLGVSDVCI